MKLARYASMFAFAAAGAFLMSVVPGAPKSASAQGPAARYECNYTTASNAQGAAAAAGTSTNGTTFVTKNVIVTIAGTSSFSGIANRRALRATVTTNILSAAGLAAGPVLSEHIFEFQNNSDGDGVCEVNEMCFVTKDEGVLTATSTVGTFNVDISMAVTRGEQQFKNLCGKLLNSRNNTSNGTPSNPAPLNRATEVSNISATSYNFVVQGSLCECHTNKTGPTDYGQQNDQGE
jgi:hypothetical protein